MLRRLIRQLPGASSQKVRWSSTASSQPRAKAGDQDDGRPQSEIDAELRSEYSREIKRTQENHVQAFLDMDATTTSEKIAEVKVARFGDAAHLRPDLARLRVVPESKAFYMKSPKHEEVIRSLNQLLQRYKSYPKVDQSQGGTPLSADDYASDIGDSSPQNYEEFRTLVQQLGQINPELLPPNVRSAIKVLMESSTDKRNSGKNRPTRNLRYLNEQGMAVTVARRKTSSARVIMTKAHDGTRGQIFVNGKSLEAYFPALRNREKIIYPLKVTQTFGEYNIWATTQGGGHTGQAGAIASAVATAVRIHNPLFIPFLAKAKCLKADPRQTLRKVYGRRGARARYTWVKR